MDNITAEDWSKACQLAIKEEKLYAKFDHIDPDIDEIEPEDQPEFQPEILVSEPAMKCPHCSFETVHKNALKIHLLSGKKCEVCDKVFHGKNGARAYENHMKSHTKMIPKCPVCGKEFRFKSHVKQHLVGGPCGRKIDN